MHEPSASALALWCGCDVGCMHAASLLICWKCPHGKCVAFTTPGTAFSLKQLLRSIQTITHSFSEPEYVRIGFLHRECCQAGVVTLYQHINTNNMYEHV